MKFFAGLGSAIGRRWQKHGRDEQAFPEIATAALEAAAPSEHVAFTDAVRWSLEAPLPTQADVAAEFGEPPLTVYADKDFRIDLLFWIDGATAIHQHSFSGAFHVLAGSSVHSRYRFSPKRRINSRLVFGELSMIGAELLKRGDTRPILAGDRGSHALFHLDRPSVTVVVRTHNEPAAMPQFTLRRPGIALDPFYKPVELTRRLQILRMAYRAELAERTDLVARYFESADVETVIRVLDALDDEIGSGKEFETLLELARPRLGKLHPTMVACYEEMARQTNITGRRGGIKDPDHRFFLALLLSLPSRETILDFVRRRYDAEPVGKVMRFLSTLSRTKPDGFGGPNAIGVALDETSLDVLRCLVEGRSLEGVIAKLAETYDGVPEQKRELALLCNAFRESLFFRTLLA